MSFACAEALSVLGALAWGSLAAASLVLGALLAFARPWSDLQVGVVLAFGAGALISAVSFELAEEGIDAGGFGWTAAGLAAGAVVLLRARRRHRAPRVRWSRAPGPRVGVERRHGACARGVPRRRSGAGRARHRPRVQRGHRREPARRDLRLEPPRGDRRRARHARGAEPREARSCCVWVAVAGVCAAATVWRATSRPTARPARSARSSTASPRARCSSCSSTR